MIRHGACPAGAGRRLEKDQDERDCAAQPPRHQTDPSLGGLGAGSSLYLWGDDEPAAAAVHQEPPAVPVEVASAVAGTVSERIEAVGTTLADQAVDVVPLTSGRIVEIGFAPGQVA